MLKYPKWYYYASEDFYRFKCRLNELNMRKIHFYILALIPPFFILYLVNRYTINVPVWDQWEFVPLLKKALVHELTLSDIWAQDSEHRIFFPRLIMLPTALLTNWNILYEISINIALAGATFFYIVSLLRRSFDGTIYKWLLLLSSLLIFSTVQWENWMWGWQIAIFLSVLGCVVAVWAVSRWPEQWRGVIIAMAFSIISSFSFNSGLLTWIVVAVMLMMQKEGKVKHLISWIAASIIAVFLYYYGYDKSAIQSPLLLPVEHPYEYMRFVLLYLGSPLGWGRENISIFIGLVLLVTTCVGTIHIRKRYKEEYDRLLPWLALGLYAFLCAIVTGIGRLGFGAHQALASRYTTFSTLFVLCSIVVTASWIKCSLKNYQCLPNKTIAFISSLSILFVLAYAVSFSHGIREFKNRNKSLQANVQCLLSIQTASDECLKKVYPIAIVARDRAKMLQEMHMSLYANQNTSFYR